MPTRRPFLPAFLNKLDQQLLKNNPVTWSTRIHLVLYYGLAFSVVLAAFCFIVPEDPRVASSIYNWVLLLSVVSLVSFVAWLIFLLRFNVFKRFGQWKRFDTAKTFILYFLVILIIISWPFIPPVVQSIRANGAYTIDELTTDINKINIKLAQLQKDSIDTRFSTDTLQLKEGVGGIVSRKIDQDLVTVDRDITNYYFIDSTALKIRLGTADSLRKLNDSVYVVYECPDLVISTGYLHRFGHIKQLRSFDIFRQVFQSRDIIDTNLVKKELAAIFAAYSPGYDIEKVPGNYDYDNWDEQTNIERIRDKYDVYHIDQVFSNIAEKKYRWDFNTIGFAWRTAYYISLVLATLLVIYRHMTRKTFFLSLLSGVVLTILTGVFMAMSYSGENIFNTWFIIYFVIFSAVSATIICSRHRNVFAGIALNLLVFITSFLPLVITAIYYSWLTTKYEFATQSVKDMVFANEELHYFFSEIAGFVVLLLLLSTLYQQAYKKWYALPDQ